MNIVECYRERFHPMPINHQLPIVIIFLLSSCHINLGHSSSMSEGIPTMMKAVKIDKPGAPQNLYIGEEPVPELKEKQVLIKVYMTAVNRADTLQRKGLYPPPPGESKILGLEAAGKVEKIGSECTGQWKIGQRVMTLLAGGGYAEYVAVHEDHLIPVPLSWTFKEAGAIPEVWLTAYQLLFIEGGFKQGMDVLIHAGGSGVGTAATQLVNKFGGNAYVTAGTKEKLATAKECGAKDGFNYKEANFSRKVMDVTFGKGADMILDCIGGSQWQQNSDSIALDGTWVLYGLLGGAGVEGDFLRAILSKRVRFIGSILRSRSNEYKAKLVKSFTLDVFPLFEKGLLKPVIDIVYPLDKIAVAHQRMEANKNIGKILLEVRPEEFHTEL